MQQPIRQWAQKRLQYECRLWHSAANGSHMPVFGPIANSNTVIYIARASIPPRIYTSWLPASMNKSDLIYEEQLWQSKSYSSKGSSASSVSFAFHVVKLYTFRAAVRPTTDSTTYVTTDATTDTTTDARADARADATTSTAQTESKLPTAVNKIEAFTVTSLQQIAFPTFILRVPPSGVSSTHQ